MYVDAGLVHALLPAPTSSVREKRQTMSGLHFLTIGSMPVQCFDRSTAICPSTDLHDAKLEKILKKKEEEAGARTSAVARAVALLVDNGAMTNDVTLLAMERGGDGGRKKVKVLGFT